jgi:predicted nuclease of restriction endonuclease-like (RecB) superfamily
MRQFYETYAGDEKVSPLVTQLPWTHNLLILSRSRRPEEREFYLWTATRGRWTKRELERQLNGALFERVVLSPARLSAPLKEQHPGAEDVFRDSYLVEFLDLPPRHSEAGLQRGLVEQLRRFLTELGRDFCFVGSQYPLQVGGRDFALDLLFFNRSLNCLVAFELKVEEFQPEQRDGRGAYERRLFSFPPPGGAAVAAAGRVTFAQAADGVATYWEYGPGWAARLDVGPLPGAPPWRAWLARAAGRVG